MKLKLTQNGYDVFQSYLKEAISLYSKNPVGQSPSIKDGYDFIYLYNKVDEFGNLETTEYKGYLNQEMEVNVDHYNDSQDLKFFVNQGYLEII